MSKYWRKKPPTKVRSVADALLSAERMRKDLPEIVQVFAWEWDKVILADEITANNKRIAELAEGCHAFIADIEALTAENAALKATLANQTQYIPPEVQVDAERWQAIELLMIVGNVELNQDEDGGYSISIDPVENEIGKVWRGDEPSEVIDQVVEESKQAAIDAAIRARNGAQEE